jgi:Fe2+ or Zn2+ uptake regulation protein
MNWAEQASRRLDEAGYRRGAARREVLDLLASERCATTALQMDTRIAAGRASIYRTLEHLERLHLVQRIDIGGDAAGYERVDLAEHHHHLVCESCGQLAPFADPALERAIEAVSGATDFEVATHEVVLRGLCPICQGAGA